MCVWTQRSSEEAFRFFGKNFPILGRSLPIFGRSLPVCGGVSPQTHFGKAFRIAASILKTHTVANACCTCHKTASWRTYSTANYVCIGCTVANLASENRRLLFRSQAGAHGATATFQPSHPLSLHCLQVWQTSTCTPAFSQTVYNIQEWFMQKSRVLTFSWVWHSIDF